MFCMTAGIGEEKKKSIWSRAWPVVGLSGSRFDVNSCLNGRQSRMQKIEWHRYPNIFSLWWSPHHKVSGTYHSKFLTYLSSGALDLSHQICFSQWTGGGRLQAHSQWDNNSEPGFDSQMKVFKRVTRGIEPHRTQHLILTLRQKLFLCPFGNMIFLCPQSIWNSLAIVR